MDRTSQRAAAGGRGVTPLRPPDRGALWARLALRQDQLAALCGVSARRVEHWTHRGYLLPDRRDPDRYPGDAVDYCLLIKQARDAGVPLRRAAALARAYLADEGARRPALQALDPVTLAALRDWLRRAQAAVNDVRQLVEADARHRGAGA